MPPKRRYELTDVQWALIESLMPRPKPGGRWNDTGPPSTARCGCSRAAHPGTTCPSATARGRNVYDRFRRWSADGTIDKSVGRLRYKLDKDGFIDWEVLTRGNGVPLAATVTVGQAHESKSFEAVMASVRPKHRRPTWVLGDKGYSVCANRASVAAFGT